MTIRRDVQSDRDKSRKEDREDPTRSYPGNDEVKRYRGDGLVVRMDSNRRALEITGDGCRITLTKNSGSVRVIGDGCRLNVSHNVGDIEYTGDGGRVLLGPRSSAEKVRFVGDDGKVILRDDPEMGARIADPEARHRTRDSQSSAGDRRNEEFGRARKTASPRKEDVAQRPTRYNDCGTVPSRECLDNAINDTKERTSGPNERRDEGSPRHRTIVTTRIVTKIQSDGKFVSKRFAGSPLIIDLTKDPVVPRESRRKLRAAGSNDASGI